MVVVVVVGNPESRVRCGAVRLLRFSGPQQVVAL